MQDVISLKEKGWLIKKAICEEEKLKLKEIVSALHSKFEVETSKLSKALKLKLKIIVKHLK